MDRIPNTDLHFDTFYRLGFIQRCGSVSDETGVRRGGWYEISPEGRRYLQYVNERIRDKAKEDRRYWITTIIAIVALIVAIASFLQSTNRVDLMQWPPRLLRP